MHSFSCASFFAILTLIILSSCSNSERDNVAKWSDSIKKRILDDCNVEPDSSRNALLHDTIEVFLKFKKGEQIVTGTIDPKSKDTMSIVYWGSDYRFAFGKRFCSDRRNESDELLLYEGKPFGMHRIFYCNGSLKREGLEADAPVGNWFDYDENGKKIKDTNYYNMNKFEKIKEIKYGDQ